MRFLTHEVSFLFSANQIETHFLREQESTLFYVRSRNLIRSDLTGETLSFSWSLLRCFVVYGYQVMENIIRSALF